MNEEDKPDHFEQLKIVDKENKRQSIIKKSIRFIIDDFISDWKFICDVVSGKKKVEFNETLTVETYLKGLKEYWWVFLLIALGFVCGMFFSSQHWQDSCNSFIIDKIIPNCTYYSQAYLSSQKGYIMQNFTLKV